MFNRYWLSATAAVLAVLIAVATANETCQNGGISGDDTHVKCSCKSGFKGFDCSQKVSPCEGRPCRNGGTCSEHKDGTFGCRCPPLFKGVLCEQRVRPCDSGPCKNGGKCADDGIKCFKCECPSGFKGPECDKIVQACEIKPCANGGQCIDEKNGRFTCKCKEGFGGIFCDRRDGLYGSKILAGNSKYITQLEEWLGGIKSWKLCYRATDHGWAASTFHTECDNKRPTVTIVKSGSYIFGGFSDLAFGGTTGYRSSTKAFIFSFVNKDSVPPFKAAIHRNINAIYTNPAYGPTFGGGHDFYVANGANANKVSYTNFGHTYTPPKGYVYSTVKAKNLLAGTYNYSPTEVETFFLY